ncbi:MAG: flagellar hook assembly protein FlgD [Limnobacter sp.]|nr:flagellar hook assembly protein FlgD [Limnobacter sp.]
MAINTTMNASNPVGKAAAKLTKEDNSPEAIQDRFMSLMIAQLKNQDPLAPMDNSQVTSQMAQLNTVTGISDMNKTMERMAAGLTGNQTVQATGMLGRTVMLEGNSLTLKGAKSEGAFELKQAADKVSVNVKDRAGNVVQSLDMGAQSKGVLEFDWDGKNTDGKTVVDGQYTFEVIATAAGQPAASVALSKTVVQGLRNGGADGALLLTSDGSEVSMSDIKQIF